MQYTIHRHVKRGSGWFAIVTIREDDGTVVSSNLQMLVDETLPPQNEMDERVQKYYDELMVSRAKIRSQPLKGGSDIIRAIDERKEDLKMKCLQYIQINGASATYENYKATLTDWQAVAMAETLLYEYAKMAVDKKYIVGTYGSPVECFDLLKQLVLNSTPIQLADMLR